MVGSVSDVCSWAGWLDTLALGGRLDWKEGQIIEKAAWLRLDIAVVKGRVWEGNSDVAS